MQQHVNLHALELEVQNLISQIEMTNFDLIWLFSKNMSSQNQNILNILNLVVCQNRNLLSFAQSAIFECFGRRMQCRVKCAVHTCTLAQEITIFGVFWLFDFLLCNY